jgi:DNA-directed RNA polymerase specialized sigma24 family protein
MLSPRRQEVVTLRFYGGLRNREIARVLGLDERTVAAHLCRAIQDLEGMCAAQTRTGLVTEAVP